MVVQLELRVQLRLQVLLVLQGSGRARTPMVVPPNANEDHNMFSFLFFVLCVINCFGTVVPVVKTGFGH